MTALYIVWVGCIIATALLFIVGMGGFIRIEWVYRTRMRVLNTMPVGSGLAAYALLPSFDEMTRRFWVWDVAKFVDPGQRAEFARLTSGQ